MEFEWKERWVPWMVLAFVFYALAGALKKTSLATQCGLVLFGTSALCIALMSLIPIVHAYSKRELNVWAFIVGAVVSCLPVMVGLNMLGVNAALVICFIGLGLVLFFQYQPFIKALNQESDYSKYFVLLPMAIWFIGGVRYFQALAAYNSWAVSLYRLGIMLFAAWAIIRVFIDIDDPRYTEISLALILLLIIGAVVASFTLPGVNWATGTSAYI